jgi:hypothetical protein
VAIIHDMNTVRYVPIMIGAAEELVKHRELRTKYCTNRSIKTWATYFLLKSLTSSGLISQWTEQKQDLLSYCKMNENSFRARLYELKALGLITMEYYNIRLVSFQKAADILGIDFKGTIKIEYDEALPGKQTFQYFLRAEELRGNMIAQLNAMMFYLEKNPLVKAQLDVLLIHAGADSTRLNNAAYFQTQLLKLQQTSFAKGSDHWDIIIQFRADINRSVNGIKENHTYKSAQSVSYMKKQLLAMKIIGVEKVKIESSTRSRIYVPDGTRKRDGYIYNPATKKTSWQLCDQVSFKYSQTFPKQNESTKRKAA